MRYLTVTCFAVASFLIGAIQALAADSDAQPLVGKVDATQNSHPTKMLNGSAKQSLPINTSVKLYPNAPARMAPPVNHYGGRVMYPFPRLIYIPNAPVTPFRRERLNVPMRSVAPVQTALAKPAPKVEAVRPEANGVMTWAPGYERTVVSQLQPTALAAVPGRLQQLDSVDLVHQPQSQLRSTPRLLTELLIPKEHRSQNWDEWYKRVCNMVYEQWLLCDCRPGKVSIRVTVWSSRDLDCRVIDFAPAPGATRNSAEESAIRDAALRAVRSLDRCSVLEFPAQFSQRKMAFDLDLNRAVDGPFGCQVVAAHGTENTMSVIH